MFLIRNYYLLFVLDFRKEHQYRVMTYVSLLLLIYGLLMKVCNVTGERIRWAVPLVVFRLFPGDVGPNGVK